MEGYDEDLQENPFLVTLKQKHKLLFDLVEVQRWTLCIPRVGSVDISELEEYDFKAHIIRVNQDAEGERITVNGQKVAIDGSSIQVYKTLSHLDQDQDASAHSDTAELFRTANVLFEEVNYNSAELSYRMVCIDVPLSGATIQAVEDAALGTFTSCEAFLWGYLSSANRKARKKIDMHLSQFEKFKGQHMETSFYKGQQVHTNLSDLVVHCTLDCCNVAFKIFHFVRVLRVRFIVFVYN
eukprot:m.177768 g.177768  ORF g.177768 m.177768 type:complete len:239 (+) comp15456_c0_seq3:125-841(+)